MVRSRKDKHERIAELLAAAADIVGEHGPEGLTASSLARRFSLRVNPISRTHAETDVLQQLSNLGGANGGLATLYIDHPGGLCGACGRSGAVRSMAGQVGMSELTVVWPGGSTVIVP